MREAKGKRLSRTIPCKFTVPVAEFPVRAQEIPCSGRFANWRLTRCKYVQLTLSIGRERPDFEKFPDHFPVFREAT
jgi:hypothetical protein